MSRLRRRVPLERRTPLARGESQLARSPLARTGGPERRAPLAPVSAKRKAGGPERRAITEAVFSRDRRCLLAPLAGRRVPPCFGPPTPHHIRKAGQGGGWTMQNIVKLCAFHNDWLEWHDGIIFGVPAGLICLRDSDLNACWDRLIRHGLVTYNPEGGPL